MKCRTVFIALKPLKWEWNRWEYLCIYCWICGIEWKRIIIIIIPVFWLSDHFASVRSFVRNFNWISSTSENIMIRRHRAWGPNTENTWNLYFRNHLHAISQVIVRDAKHSSIHFLSFCPLLLETHPCCTPPTNNCNNLKAESSSSGISGEGNCVFVCRKCCRKTGINSQECSSLAPRILFPKVAKRNETVAVSQAWLMQRRYTTGAITTVKCTTLLIPCVAVEETNNNNNT